MQKSHRTELTEMVYLARSGIQSLDSHICFIKPVQGLANFVVVEKVEIFDVPHVQAPSGLSETLL